jgi:DNA-binding response OmpR family regulator
MDALASELASDSLLLVVCDTALADGGCEALMSHLSGQLDRSVKLVIVSEQRELAVRLMALRAGAAFVRKPAHPALVLRGLRPSRLDAPARLLVVDDSITYGNALADALSVAGHDVVLATSAREARDYLSLEQPELALLDVFLPDADGIELARSLRASVATRNLPIVILTGRESTTVRQRAAEASVTHFVAKNTPLSEIRTTVQALLMARKPSGTWRAAVPRGGSELFASVVAASGLSEILARSLLERALARVGADITSLTPEALRSALPEIGRALATFLAPADARQRLQAITTLIQEGPN